jgi:DNA replication ATP-dependent helicase Dna2
VDLTLEQRLLRFLEREEEGERRQQEDLRSLTIEDRILEGECIGGAVVVERREDAWVLEAHENLAKFREGDAVVVGDGLDFGRGVPLVYGGYDAERHLVTLTADPYQRMPFADLQRGRSWCIDRRSLNLRSRLHDAVGLGFANDRIRAALSGQLPIERDAERELRAEKAFSRLDLDPTQQKAAVAAVGTQSLALVQGPPGTGKTALLAAVAATLCAAGCRIALCAFTHRAVDNALVALRRRAPDLPLFKLVSGTDAAPDLLAAGVQLVRPGRGRAALPQKGVVVAGTCFQLLKLPPTERFHYVIFDEAGQLPIPHALAGMLLSQRWLFFGDHRQLPPVVTAEHHDPESTMSIFERLHGSYGSHLLETSYRLNDGICALISELFYGGRLRPAPVAAGRRMAFTPGGAHDEVLDPSRPVVLARVDHLQPGTRSGEEASLCADLVHEAVVRHRVPAPDVAIIAPFRAQVRAIRSALQRKGTPRSEEIVVDTVDRVQGQERELVVISLTSGDPESLNARAAFFYSTNRLNVSISRARSKAVIVASRGAFAALPAEPAHLCSASTFKRLYRLVPQVDLTAVYGAS